MEKNSKKIIFIRHAKTLKNDGSFLGQSRNPKIIKKKYNIKKISFSKIYTSPLIRCIETANILSSKKEYFVDKNLLEINYGELEGMNIYELNQKYPKLIQKWSKGQDPKFPKGESQKDVLKRIKMFINKIKKDKSKNICVISHNVFLRCLIGEYFQIPKQKWYKINIPHLMKLEFVVIKNNIYPNMDRKKFKIIFSNLY